MPVDPLHIFASAAIGSVAVEVLDIVRAYRRPGSMPGRFFKWHFWLWRSILAILIGGMAVEFGIEHPGYAIYFGVSAPALIDAMANNPPPIERG